MPDAALGQPYTAAILIRDSNGSPLTSGETGTMTIAGPDSTATLTSGAISHQGYGWWGIPVAGSFLTSPGTYTANIAALGGTVSGTNVGYAFSVGRVEPWQPTLRDFLAELVEHLGDGWLSTSTGAGSTTTLVDSAYAWGDANTWVGSELVILEPGNVADARSVRVTAFNQANGTFTFTPAVTSVGSGVDYVLLNRRGTGWRLGQYLAEIGQALRRLGVREEVADRVTLTTTNVDFEYAIPAGWAAVTGVLWHDNYSGYTGDWCRLAPDRVTVDPVRRVVRLDAPYYFLSGTPLEIRGLVYAQPPRFWSSWLPAATPGQLATLRELALARLQVISPRPEDRQAAVLRLRELEGGLPRRLARTNEVGL
ncbi:MAG TPA: hypothetical protein VF041_23065 [Gemmatimonadaceae bacterium]